MLRRCQTPRFPQGSAYLPRLQPLWAPCPYRHEQLQAQRASVEAQEVALLAERERLIEDGHRQRGLEEELRRLQNEHDRYQLCGRHAAPPHEKWVSHCPCMPCFASFLWVWLLESSCLCLQRAQMLLAEVSRERGELQGERGELRGRLARLELERAQLEMQSQQLRESNQQLDLSACRLTTQCEVWLCRGGLG